MENMNYNVWKQNIYIYFIQRLHEIQDKVQMRVFLIFGYITRDDDIILVCIMFGRFEHNSIAFRRIEEVVNHHQQWDKIQFHCAENKY